jgi:alpha-beta hydrolase superfamily lysophospholipase
MTRHTFTARNASNGETCNGVDAMKLFTDPLHDEFARWALGFVPAGGADVGEIFAIAEHEQDPDDDEFFELWSGAARRHHDDAEAAVVAGHHAAARAHYLREAGLLTVAYHPLYGTPVDPRLVDAFERQRTAFACAMARGAPPAESVTIPFEGHDMPGYFVPARDAKEGERRPLVIATNGYDATIVDMYFAIAHDTVARGYHCLVFDGPGQGAMLVRDGVPLVADWERVVAPVVDAALARPDVDPDRIVLHGWSLGGYLALRAASGEHRLAACVADPAFPGILDTMGAMRSMVGMSAEAVAALPEISDTDVAKIEHLIEHDRFLHWSFVQRGYWVNGASDLRGWLAAIAPFSMTGRAEHIRCPVLGTTTEGDPLALYAESLLAQMKCPTTLLRFTNAEGAGGHCEMLNRPLLNERVLDWLDDTLA